MDFDLSNMPPRIAALPRDRRGLPIPVVVMRDANGSPHFTMNDARKAALYARDGFCAICGDRLGAFKCFVGGPASAFHPAGRYFDGPIHQECGVFALHACPYLALAGSYARRIGARTLRPKAIGAGRVLIAEDPTVHPPQPAVFVLGSCKRFHVEGRHFVPERPWAEVRFFRAGQEIGSDRARVMQLLDKPLRTAEVLRAWRDEVVTLQLKLEGQAIGLAPEPPKPAPQPAARTANLQACARNVHAWGPIDANGWARCMACGYVSITGGSVANGAPGGGVEVARATVLELP